MRRWGVLGGPVSRGEVGLTGEGEGANATDCPVE